MLRVLHQDRTYSGTGKPLSLDVALLNKTQLLQVEIAARLVFLEEAGGSLRNPGRGWRAPLA